jgi:pyruvyltransferase
MINQSINAYWCLSSNFGDALTPYIINKLSGKDVIYTKPGDTVAYMATGSMLDDDITNCIIWGCGIAWMKDTVRKPLEFRAVRGPISYKRTIDCGHSCPEIWGDPALLLPLLYKPKRRNEYRLGIIPHYIDLAKVVKLYGENNNIKIINILDPIEKVIDDIIDCDNIVSSSLHGLITAQAYQRPNVWAEFSNNIIGDGTKFADFFLSVGLEPYIPLDLRESKIDSMPDIVYSESKINLKKLIDACPFDDLKIL